MALEPMWCRTIVTYNADLQRRGCQFETSICQIPNVIDEEGNGKPLSEPHFPIETQSPVSGFCYARSRVYNAVLLGPNNMSPLTAPVHLVRSHLPSFPIQNVFSVHIRKRAGRLSQVSPGHCHLGEGAENSRM